MRVRNITSSIREQLCYCFLLLTSVAGYAQLTVTASSPTKVTHRSSITITGTGFTATSTVRFYTAAATTADYAITSSAYTLATQVTYVSPTEIRAILPAVMAAGGDSAARYFRVVNQSGSGSNITYTFTDARQYTYVPPKNYASTSGITEVVTNWNNGSQTFWKSTSASTNASLQPDGAHSVMGFRYGGKMYSTGNETAITDVLNAAGYTTAGSVGTGTGYITGNFRALPIKNIQGVVPNTGPNLIVLGSRIDGSATTQVPTAPNVAGLSIRDVLIDGTRGLNIGTGVTNLPSTAVLTFEAQNIVATGVADGVPDIIVSQIAEPTDGSFSVYSFTDVNGDIVGYPVQVAFSNTGVPVIGRYKSDFFTLPVGQPLTTAEVNGSLLIGAPTRDIRMVAYKIGDFGITTDNASQARYFKVMPSGTSDPAFMAYNRNRFLIPAPEITSQPSSQAICPGGTATFQVTVAATSSGTETPAYQWEKNGVPLANGGNISGATAATLTINPITTADAGAYRCLVTNASGAALSNNAYLNTVITSGPDVATCQNVAATIEVSALGNTPVYEWYVNTTNSATGGSLIQGATSSTYSPPVNVAGVKWYYAKSRPTNITCADAVVTSNPIEFTVVTNTVGGVVSPLTQSVCPGGYATVAVSEYTGTIQWQQSATNTSDNSAWTDITTTTTATTPTLYINSVTATTYYRAKISGSCGGTAYSQVATVNVNDEYTWTGVVNTDWSNAGNWSCNAIPTMTTTVIIPAGTPHAPEVFTIQALAKSVSVEAGTGVTVKPGGTLNVANAVNVADGATFLVENNAALVQVNAAANTGNITVRRNSNALYRLDYTLWSSPVAGQGLYAFSPLTSINPSRFYTYGYAPSNNAEIYQTIAIPNTDVNNPAQPTFQAAQGYLIRMPNSLPDVANYNSGGATHVVQGEFTGVPHNGNQQPVMSINGVNQADHYFATGNPYPSPISVYDFLMDTDNASRIANGSALYFWRKKNNYSVSSYATLTLQGFIANNVSAAEDPTQDGQGGQANAQFYPTVPTGANQQWIISPGQGFLVGLKANISQNIVFKNSMRRAATTTATATSGQPFFRTLNNGVPSRFWLNLADETGAYSQTLVSYTEDGTLGVDYGHDGFEFAEGSIRLYSVEGGNNFGIQARPVFNDADVVPVGFTVTAAGQYTVRLFDKDGLFAEGQTIYLKDNMLGTTFNLSEGDYSFTTEAGSFTNRFEVVYTTSSLGAPGFELADVLVYKQNGTNIINVTSGSAPLTGVKVFDIRGRELYNGTATGNQAAVALNIAQQVVVVEVTTTSGRAIRKIIF